VACLPEGPGLAKAQAAADREAERDRLASEEDRRVKEHVAAMSGPMPKGFAGVKGGSPR
jgi:hypothetical protein